MIDSLLRYLPKVRERDTLQRFGVAPGNYATMTLHRPSNVDDREVLAGIIDAISDFSRTQPVLWPVHPRARQMLEELKLSHTLNEASGLKLIDPLGYLDMLALNRSARLIMTDSGGLQEEATVLRVPCVTLRDNTERPVTVDSGCNHIAGNDPVGIRLAIDGALHRNGAQFHIPELWDGRAAMRIYNALLRAIH